MYFRTYATSQLHTSLNSGLLIVLKALNCHLNMTLAEFTKPSLLVPELLNERQESVIAELSKRLADAGRIKNARVFASAVLQHESLVSTVFEQVALCLARGHTALELSFAIGLSEHGVRWGKRASPPVFVIVLFAIPASAEEKYLSVLMTFSNLLKDKTFLTSLRASQDSDEMFKALSRTSLRDKERD
jgi:mannitol/fructose-specific phosphotransferase system IIA component (Ntr-type)